MGYSHIYSVKGAIYMAKNKSNLLAMAIHLKPENRSYLNGPLLVVVFFFVPFCLCAFCVCLCVLSVDVFM